MSLSNNNKKIMAEDEQYVYISGICHPPPLDKSQILPEERWDKYDKDTLSQISSKMIGVPITIDHPVDSNGLPILHEQYVSTKRGEVVSSKILEDGSCHFVAKCPRSRNVKTKMFSNDLAKGRYKEFSLGVQFNINPETFEESYVPNHIAILEDGKARRPGCKLLEVLDLSKKSFANTKADDIDVLKKEKEKILHRRRLQHSLLSIASNMSTSTPVQDDAPATSAPATIPPQQQQQPPAQQSSGEPKPLTDDDLYASVASGTIPYEELAKFVVEARKSNLEKAQQLAEFRRQMEENEAKAVAEKEEQMLQQYIEIANIDLNPDEPISDEARQRNALKIREVWAKLPQNLPLETKKALIQTNMELNGAISVASSGEKISTIIERTNQALRSYDAARRSGQLRSSLESRFEMPGLQKSAPAGANLQQRSDALLHQKTSTFALKASVPKRPEHDAIWSQLEAATKPGFVLNRSDIPSTDIFRKQTERMSALDSIRNQISR